MATKIATISKLDMIDYPTRVLLIVPKKQTSNVDMLISLLNPDKVYQNRLDQYVLQFNK